MFHIFATKERNEQIVFQCLLSQLSFQRSTICEYLFLLVVVSIHEENNRGKLYVKGLGMWFYLLVVSQVALCIIKQILTMIELHAEVTGEFIESSCFSGC